MESIPSEEHEQGNVVQQEEQQQDDAILASIQQQMMAVRRTRHALHKGNVEVAALLDRVKKEIEAVSGATLPDVPSSQEE